MENFVLVIYIIRGKIKVDAYHIVTWMRCNGTT